MNCITVIGMTGEGKSKFVKTFIKDKNCFIYDVQKEYNLPYDNSLSRSSFIGDEKKFIEIALKKRNTVIVFEEATFFIEGKINRSLRELIISKRHTGNVIILCFHSITSVPPRILQLSDYTVVFKTNDERYQVEKKYPSLLDAYDNLKKAAKYTMITKKN